MGIEIILLVLCLWIHLVMQSLRPEVMRLRTAVDKATSSREQYVDKFCHHLGKDITELGRDVKEIKNQGLVSCSSYFHCRCTCRC